MSRFFKIGDELQRARAASPQAQASNDYSQDINNDTILKDERFLDDLRTHFEKEGRYFATDEAMVREWATDNIWGDFNTVSMAKDAVQAATDDPETRARKRRLTQVWNSVPYIRENLGSSIGSIAAAAILDPVNVIPVAGAYGKAAQASRAAYLAGKSTLGPALKAGIKTGAIAEGTINAGVAGVQDAITQNRDINLGLQDEFSGSRLLTSTGIGGIMGAGIGGVIGAGAAVNPIKSGQRAGVKFVDDLRAAGFADDQIARMDYGTMKAATSSPEEAARILRETQVSDAASGTPTHAEDGTPLTPEQQAVELARQKVASSNERLSGVTDTINGRRIHIGDRISEIKAKLEDPTTEPAEAIGLNKELIEQQEEAAIIEKLNNELIELNAEGGALDQSAAQTNSDNAESIGARIVELEKNVDQIEEMVAAGKSREEIAQWLNTSQQQRAARAEADPAAPEEPTITTDQPTTPETPETPEQPSAKPEGAEKIEVSAEEPMRAAAYLERHYSKDKGGHVITVHAADKSILSEEVAPTGKKAAARLSELEGELGLEVGRTQRLFEEAQKGKKDGRRAAKATSPDTLEEAPVAAEEFDNGGYNAADHLTPAAAKTLASKNITPDELNPLLDAGEITLNKDGKIIQRDIFKAVKQIEETKKAEAAQPDVTPEQAELNAEIHQELGEIYDMLRQGDVLEELFEPANQPLFREIIGQQLKARGSKNTKGVLEMHDNEIANTKVISHSTDGAALPEDFTASEIKRIRRFTKQYKSQGHGDTVALSMAKMRVAAERGSTNAKRSNIPSGTGRAVSTLESGPKTTGRANNGLLQSFLRSGGKFKETEDGGLARVKAKDIKDGEEGVFSIDNKYIPKSSDMGIDQIIAQVRTGKAPHGIYEITTTGRTRVIGRSGKTETVGGRTFVEAGNTVFLDTRTKKVYATKGTALKATGIKNAKVEVPEERLIKKEPAAPTRTASELLARIKAGESLEDVMASIKGEKTVAAPKADEVAEEVLPALKRGDKVLALRHKETGELRVAGENQIADESGLTAEALLKKAAQKGGGYDDWEAKYIPRGLKGDRLQRRAFDMAADEAEDFLTKHTPVSRVEAGLASSQGAPLTYEEASEIKLNLSEISKDTMDYGFAPPENSSDIKTIRQHISSYLAPEATDVTPAHLAIILGDLERAAWPKDSVALNQHINTIAELNQLLFTHAPQGIKPDGISRAASRESLNAVLKGYSSDVVEMANDMLTRLGGDKSIGPRWDKDWDSWGYEETYIGSGTPSTKIRKESRITVGYTKGGTIAGMPEISLFYHELSHWAYKNILTPADRADFWTAMKKFVADGGDISEYLPNANGGGATNASVSPQELFANQFSMWATRREMPANMQQPTFWERMGTYIKAVLDRMFRRAKIDPELEPLFAKILDEPSTLIPERPATPTGAGPQPLTYHIQKRYNELNYIRGEWSAALESGNVDQMIEATREMARHLASVGTSRWYNEATAKGSKEITAKTGVFSPYAGKHGGESIISRIRSLQNNLYEVMKGERPENAAAQKIGLSRADEIDDLIKQSAEDESIGEIQQLFAEEAHVDASGFGSGQDIDTWEGYGIVEIDTKKADELIEVWSDAEATFGIMEEALQRTYHRRMEGQKRAHLSEGLPPELSATSSATPSKNTVKKLIKGKRKIVAADNVRSKRAMAKKPIDRKIKTRKVAGGEVVLNRDVTKSIRGMSREELLKEYEVVHGTDRGDQVAYEILRQARSERDKPKYNKASEKINSLNTADLERGMMEAIIDNDTVAMDAYDYEIWRRAEKKRLKKGGGDAKRLARRQFKRSVTSKAVVNSIGMEVSQSLGLPDNNGIPASARFAIRDTLSSMTHRDGNIQQSMRTMAYRILSLGGHAEDTGSTINLIKEGDIADITGQSVGDPKRIASGTTAALKEFRSNMRQAAASLSRDDAEGDKAIKTLAAYITRSMLTPEQADMVAKAAREVGAEDSVEWFVSNVHKYLDGSTKASNLFEGTSDIAAVRGAMDDVVDGIAYVTNGMLGGMKVRAKFKHLLYYGDMFEVPTKKMFTSRVDHPSVAPEYAADYVAEALDNMSPGKMAKVLRFIDGGKGQVDGRATPFYHGTPNGVRLSDANPDASLSPSRVGVYGEGIYLTKNAVVADKVYSKVSTIESFFKRIEALEDVLPQEQIDEAYDLGTGLISVREEIGNLRRELSGQNDDLSDYILRDQLSDALKAERVILDELDMLGVKQTPAVLPVFVKAKNTLDLSKSSTFVQESPFISMLATTVGRTNGLSERTFNDFVSRIPPVDSGQTETGSQVYIELVKSIQNNEGISKAAAQARVSSILQNNGYDSIAVTFNNLLNDSLIKHDGIIIFKSENVKHIDATDFDDDNITLYNTLRPTSDRGAMNTSIISHATTKAEIGQIAPAIAHHAERSGATPPFVDALVALAKGKNLSSQNTRVLKKAFDPQLQSNSNRLREVGFNWLAEFGERVFPQTHSRLAKNYFPLQKALRSLEGAPSGIKRWGQTIRNGIPLLGKDAQPDSYKRVLKALRYGTGSRQERALKPLEREAFVKIRDAFADELETMRSAGIFVGKRKNYVPQIWNADKIRANEGEFLTKMAAYYKRDAAEFGVEMSDEKANLLAQSTYIKLAEDGSDGIIMPQKTSSPSGGVDNIDHSRVIELDKYPDQLKELEGFLEDDLEAMLVKYFEGSARKTIHAQKFGSNALQSFVSHGLYDYMSVMSGGREAIRHLLSHPRVHRKSLPVTHPEARAAETLVMENVTNMPLKRANDADSLARVDEIMAMHKESSARARDFLLEMGVDRLPDGSNKPAYVRRVDAIIGALDDALQGGEHRFGGIDASEYDFAAEYMDALGKKRHVTGYAKEKRVAASRAIRTTNSVTLLSYTMLTSLGDTVLPLIRSGDMVAWTKALTKMATNPQYRESIENIGAAMENIVHDRMVGMFGATDNRMSAAFFNATGLTPWTDMQRKMAAATGYEYFKRLQREALNVYDPSLPPQAQNRTYRTAYRQLRKYGLEDWIGSRSMDNMGDSKWMSDDEGLRMAVIKFTNDAIFAPNANDIPLWAQSPEGKIIFQLKSFPLMFGRMTGDIIKEAYRFFKHGDGDIRPLLMLATVGPAGGATALAAKDILQMRGGDDETSADLRKRNVLKTMGYDEKIHGNEDNFLGWYVEGFIMMGGLGLLGDIVHNSASQLDNGAYGFQRVAGAILGPTVGLGNTAFNVTAGISDAVFDSTPDSNAKERTAVSEAARRIPFLGGNKAFVNMVREELGGPAKSGRGGSRPKRRERTP